MGKSKWEHTVTINGSPVAAFGPIEAGDSEYLRKPNPVDALTKISAMWADNARDAAGSAVDAVWPKDEVIDITTQEQANELGVGDVFAEVAKRPQETP